MFRFVYKMERRDNEDMLVLYSYTPVEYEFSTELGEIKKNAINTVGKIREFAQKNLASFNIKNPTVLLIINGVILGSVKLTQLLTKTKG